LLNRTVLLLAIIPAWVPGSQQDAHNFLLSIFQKFLINSGSQCIYLLWAL